MILPTWTYTLRGLIVLLIISLPAVLLINGAQENHLKEYRGNSGFTPYVAAYGPPPPLPQSRALTETELVWAQRGNDITAGDVFLVDCSDDGLMCILAGESAHYYMWDGSVWSDLRKYPAISYQESVAISGDGSVVAIGGYSFDSANGVESGRVAVYSALSSGIIYLYGDEDFDYFGRSVALNYDGTILAVGAPQRSGSGYIRIFQCDIRSSCNQMGSDIKGSDDFDNIGIMVSLSSAGTTVGYGSLSAVAKVFEWRNGWIQKGSSFPSGQQASLSDDGDTVAVFIIAGDSYVLVYDWIGEEWIQRGSSINTYIAPHESIPRQFSIYHRIMSLAFSGNGLTVAIGATGSDINGVDSGTVTVYDWNGTAWMQVAATIDGELAGEELGGSVSLSTDGQSIAIGARGSYEVRSYYRAIVPIVPPSDDDDASWEQMGNSLTAPSLTGGQFGYSTVVSADGQTIAVGGLAFARVYHWDANSDSYIQRGGDIPSGFGVSLSDDGLSIAVAKSASVYDWNGSSWIQRGTILATFDGYAASLCGDGNTVAIGTIRESLSGILFGGIVQVYEWDGTAWTLKGATINGDTVYGHTGTAVALSSNGDVLAVGTPGGNGNGSRSGYIRVYSFEAGNWVQRGTDLDGEIGDNMGYAVSISADGLAVAVAGPSSGLPLLFGIPIGGIPSLDGPGRVRIYDWTGSIWLQRGDDIVGQTADERSGHSVSIASDGLTIAIGSNYNSDVEPWAGVVRVFAWTGSAWSQRGDTIEGLDQGDETGYSVAIDARGYTLIVGSIGIGSGSAAVYSFPSPSDVPTAVPTTPPSTVPTAVPSATLVTALPTLRPTPAPVVIESTHPYGRNLVEAWFVEFPAVNCYIVEMDPQSWTRESEDSVKLFTYNYNVDNYPVLSQVGTRLFKARLQDFGTQQVTGDGVKVRFVTDNGGGSWGFRLTISACPV